LVDLVLTQWLALLVPLRPILQLGSDACLVVVVEEEEEEEEEEEG